MTADDMARGYFTLAIVRADALPVFHSAASWPNVVREAQEAVELFLKAALRSVGVEPAKTHDVAPQLRTSAARFPEWFAEHVADLAFISAQLAGDRGASYYVDERSNLPPDKLFDQADAERAMEQAAFVRGVCTRLLSPVAEE